MATRVVPSAAPSILSTLKQRYRMQISGATWHKVALVVIRPAVRQWPKVAQCKPMIPTLRYNACP